MKRGVVVCAGMALFLVAGLSVLAAAPPALVMEQAPTPQVLEKAEEEVAALRVQAVTLPERERRKVEKLLRDAASRLDGVQESAPTLNPRLAKYLQNETRVANSRIEEARKIVEQGGIQ